MRARIGSVDPTLAAIVAEGFFSRLSFGLISFALPLYAVRELGLSLAQVGILLSLNLMVAVLLKPFMGALADRVGMKPSLTAAIGLRSLVSLLLAFAWYQTAKSLAGNAGKASAGILLTLTAANYTFVFLLAFVLSALPILIVLRSIGGGSEQEHVPVAAAEREQPRSTNQAPRLLPFMGLGFMISSTAYMLANLFPVFAVEYVGLSEAQAGLVYVVSMVVVLSGPAFGWLSDNVSRSLVLSVRSVANVLSSAVYLAAPNLAGVLIGRAIDDTGKAAFRPAWGSVMAHVAGFDRQRRARTMGALSSGEDAGEIAGPVLAGLLWSMWGVPVLLAVRIGLAVAAEAYAIVLLRSIDRPRPDVVLLEPSRRWRGTDDSVGAWLARAAPGARPEEIARAWSRAGLSVPLQAVWTQPLAALTADDRSRLPHAASLAADPAALARGDLVSMSEPTAHARTPTASSPAGS
jgi:MFS family permease